MKKLILAVVLGGVVAVTAAVTQRAPEPVTDEVKVDLDQVNAKIDARLHVVLQGLIARGK